MSILNQLTTLLQIQKRETEIIRPPKKQILISDPIFNQTTSGFAMELSKAKEANPQEIEIVLNSEGGDIDCARAIGSLILQERNNFTINTLAIGAVNSAATLIYSLGEKRRIAYDATMLFHKVGGELGGMSVSRIMQLWNNGNPLKGGIPYSEIDRNILKSFVNQILIHNKQYYQQVADNLNISVTTILELVNANHGRGTILDAIQAQRLGIATEIVDYGQKSLPYHN